MGDVIAFLKKPSGAKIDSKSGALHYTGQSGSLHSARIVLVGLLEKIDSPEAFDALVAVLPDPELANTSTVLKALLRMDPEGSRIKSGLCQVGTIRRSRGSMGWGARAGEN
jgi:hypothetical protein